MSAGRENFCPHLPEVAEVLDFTVTRRHGADKGMAFYRDALRFSQSLWQQGKPAQAILQLDKAWIAHLADGEDWLTDDMDPWSAMAWMLHRLRDGIPGFGGNPVRHFQHLASRMSGARPEPRRWRAWACLHLAESILPQDGYQRDGSQLTREGLWIPGVRRALAGLYRHGWPDEAAHVGKVLKLPRF